MEREQIRPLAAVIEAALSAALTYTAGNQKQAAKLLGISERKMSYQVRKYGLSRGRGAWAWRSEPAPPSAAAAETRKILDGLGK